MAKTFRSLFALGLAIASFTHFSRAEEDAKTFNVRGVNPDGKGGYTGTVELRKHADTIDVRWVTGKDNVETLGFGIKGRDIIGAGYGGAALYSIAVYELDGKKIHATWALTSQPGTANQYDLKGAATFDGVYKFSDGAPGTVVMTPIGGGAYKMVWNLVVGHFEGIGVKLGNSLVAVAGAPGAPIGVAAYHQGSEGIEGVWTSAGLASAGQEFWTPQGAAKAPPTAAAPAPEEGKPISFGGEQYFLKNSTSSPGEPTSEIREFLRPGEDWDGYSKLIAFRLMSNAVKGDAATLAKGILAETKKNHPESFTKEILLQPDRAVIFFIVIAGQQAELNIWDIRKTRNGFPSAQFVVRNKAPYETPQKFQAERDAHFADWGKELTELAGHTEEILAATSKDASAAAPPAPPAQNAPKDKISPELVDAIQADLQKCGGIAEKFVGFMKEGDIKSAVGLMSESAFTKYTRADFIAGLTKIGKLLGPLQNFSPDKAGTDFGMVDGVMSFTLKGDAKYANGTAKETFRFNRIRGEILFVSYTRQNQ